MERTSLSFISAGRVRDQLLKLVRASQNSNYVASNLKENLIFRDVKNIGENIVTRYELLQELSVELGRNYELFLCLFPPLSNS